MNFTLPQRLAIWVFRWGPAILIGHRHGWWWGLLAFAILLVAGAVIGWTTLNHIPPRHMELFGFVKLAGLGAIATAVAFLA